MRLLPEPFCRRHSVVVLGKIDAQAPDTPVIIGMTDPDNQSPRFRISDFQRRATQPVKLNRYEIDTALRSGFGAGPRTKSDLVIRERPPSPHPPSSVERRPQDGRIRAVLVQGEEHKVVDYRVSVVPSPGGEDVVIRVLERFWSTWACPRQVRGRPRSAGPEAAGC